MKCVSSIRCGLSYFTIHDSTIHDPTMHNSCINYAFLCMPWTDQWEEGGAKATPHWKVKRFHWIIQNGFDFFHLKRKSDEIEHSIFLLMHIQFWIAILFAARVYWYKPCIISKFSLMWIWKGAICMCSMKYAFWKVVHDLVLYITFILT